VYFKNCVIGGPGSFALTVSKWDQFDSVLRQKLLSEIVASNLLFIPASVRTTRQPYDCSAPGEQPGR
jgi:hypothetical protein